MITVDKVNSVVRSNVQTEGKFTIKNCGKAFRILSDGLYSDKVTAIIRELSCNAYDAHIAGKRLDKPFLVQLPNRLVPTFMLRDYGIGLSHNDVINVYTTYFQSTKTESNDYVGCLGLGSKSPFSYVDNFSIISYFNGEKRVYNAFINEEETPTIALLDTSKTDEENGLEISFPVQNYDVFEFCSKAQSIYHYFKMKPEVKGNDSFRMTSPEYVFKGNGWGVKNSTCGGARAIMGNVSYPINCNTALTTKQNMLKNCGIDIEFNIGDLEVSASRESLSFNTRTIQNIKDRFDIIIKEISDIVSKKIEGCTNLWEARLFAKNIVHGELVCIKGLLEDGALVWQGHKVGQSFVEIPSTIHLIDVSMFQSVSSRRSSTAKIRRSVTGTITISDKIKLFRNDLKVGSHIRCKSVLSSDVAQVYLVDGADSEVNALADFLGVNEIAPISSIERIKGTSVSGYNAKNTKKMFVYDFTNGGSSQDRWKIDSIDTKAGGLYVVIDRYKILGQKSHWYMNEVIEQLQEIGIDLTTQKVVGVKSGYDSKLTGAWVRLQDYVKGEIEKYIVANKYDEKVSLNNKLQELISKNNSSSHEYFLNVKFPVGSMIETYQKEMLDLIEKKGKCNDEKVDEILKLAQKYNVRMDKQTTLTLTYTWGDIVEKYSMLQLVDSYWSFRNEDNKKIVMDYIEMVEKNK